MGDIYMEQCAKRFSWAWDLATVVLLVLFGFYALWLLPQVGVSWDEHFHHDWGAQQWDNFAKLFKGESTLAEFLQLRQSSVHPGFYDLVLQLLVHSGVLGDMGINQAGHSLSVIFGLFGLAGTWLLGRELLGAPGGFWAVLLLLCMPRYFGHLWFNPKDIPFAVCVVWSLWFAVRFAYSLPKPSWLMVLGLGVATGCALGVRIAGILVPAYLGLILLLGILVSRELRQVWFTLIGKGVVAALLAYLVVLPFWPALWPTLGDAASDGVLGAAARAQSFEWNYPVLYGGDFIRADSLPWHYLPRWLLITVPEWTLVLWAVGMVGGVGWLWRVRLGFWDERRSRGWALVFLAASFPVLYVMVTGPTVYDGMRHFLFVLPPIAVLAAGGLQSGADFLRRFVSGPVLISRLPSYMTLLLCGWLVFTEYAALHPYYYSYFNGWVGGLRGAYTQYETDYWGLSYREAVEGLNAYLTETDPEGGPYSLAISGTPHFVDEFMGDQLVFADSVESADFYIAYTRLNRHLLGKGQVLLTVHRLGVPLNVVWDQRGVGVEREQP